MTKIDGKNQIQYNLRYVMFMLISLTSYITKAACDCSYLRTSFLLMNYC